MQESTRSSADERKGRELLDCVWHGRVRQSWNNTRNFPNTKSANLFELKHLGPKVYGNAVVSHRQMNVCVCARVCMRENRHSIQIFRDILNPIISHLERQYNVNKYLSFFNLTMRYLV